jgi:hypothetical protein
MTFPGFVCDKMGQSHNKGWIWEPKVTIHSLLLDKFSVLSAFRDTV